MFLLASGPSFTYNTFNAICKFRPYFDLTHKYFLYANFRTSLGLKVPLSDFTK